MRVLIADDHPVVRRGVRDIIEMQPGWDVCAEASDGSVVVELALETKPDVVVMDVSLPRLGGLEATRRLKAALPEVEVLIFTMHDDDKTIAGGLAAGARGYLLKTDADGHLVAAITALAAGRPYFSPFVADHLRGEGRGLL